MAASLTVPAFNGHFEKQREALFRSISSAQEADGSFCCNPGSDRADGKGIDYYPGEALVALLLNAQAGDREKLKLVNVAFEYYRDHFRTKPTTAFVGWHAEAWSRAASLCGNSDYAAFVFEQVDWLLGLQLTDRSRDGLNGGFIVQTAVPPSVSSVVYTEAVVRGLAAARRLGDTVRMERYKKSALAGLRFCLQLIVSREQAGFLEEPDRAYGGVTGSLHTFDVRADHVQHTITLLLATLEQAASLDIA
ncbi:hypothetical protein [Dyella monticola]|uniref:hypothetical protein n=1 Tax=Dyella monticola TaxID=1927958 RepID=UPI0011C068A4|nr:hypothetical protein [Dyella monticola]